MDRVQKVMKQTDTVLHLHEHFDKKASLAHDNLLVPNKILT